MGAGHWKFLVGLKGNVGRHGWVNSNGDRVLGIVVRILGNVAG